VSISLPDGQSCHIDAVDAVDAADRVNCIDDNGAGNVMRSAVI
jgi:hypothetical protein